MAWELFQWGSRGLWHKTPTEGIYVAHIFIRDGIRVVIEATSATGGELLNVIHVQNPGGGPSYADCLAVANVVSAWVASDYKNMWAGHIQMRQVVATGMDGAPAAQATVPSGTVGSRGGSDLPNMVTCAVKFSTNSSGRRRRGRVYSWPPTEPDVNGDHFVASYITAIMGVWRNLAAALATAGYPLAIASLRDAKMYPVTGINVVDDVVDAQRRRLLQRGR